MIIWLIKFLALYLSYLSIARAVVLLIWWKYFYCFLSFSFSIIRPLQQVLNLLVSSQRICFRFSCRSFWLSLLLFSSIHFAVICWLWALRIYLLNLSYRNQKIVNRRLCDPIIELNRFPGPNLQKFFTEVFYHLFWLWKVLFLLVEQVFWRWEKADFMIFRSLWTFSWNWLW